MQKGANRIFDTVKHVTQRVPFFCGGAQSCRDKNDVQKARV